MKPQEVDEVVFVKTTRTNKRRALGSLDNRDLTNRNIDVETNKSRRTSRTRNGKKLRPSLPGSPPPCKEPTLQCGICFDDEVESKVFKLGFCSHAYCSGCMQQYLKVVALETKKFPVPCPGCTESLDVWRCVDALNANKARAAADALAQLAIARTQVTTVKYCSNAECATPFEYDGDGDRSTARIKCPLCKTSTCVLCSKAWHQGPCELTKEEEALKNDERYKQCPSCDELIERADGCNFVRCRCGTGFCFRCGVKYRSLEPSRSNEHGIAGCNCAIYQGTRYEAAVQRARERFRAWKNENSRLHDSLSAKSWKVYCDMQWKVMFREEYHRVRNGDAAPAGG